MSISVETGRKMTLTYNIIILLFFCVSTSWTRSHVDFEFNELIERDYEVNFQANNNDVYSTQFKDTQRREERVFIQIYYEVLCPHCVNFFLKQFAPVLKTMSQYIGFFTVPFGNAKIIYDNGDLMVKCQHGPDECYGNKLHACAIDSLEYTTALEYNICLMNSTVGLGSDDEAADRCGKSMDVDSEPIKACAKGATGMERLLYYGQISKNNNLSYVPYVLINGKEYKGHDFKSGVCAAFHHPPPPCKN